MHILPISVRLPRLFGEFNVARLATHPITSARGLSMETTPARPLAELLQAVRGCCQTGPEPALATAVFQSSNVRLSHQPKKGGIELAINNQLSWTITAHLLAGRETGKETILP
jgi:hypothetical protein